MSDCASLDSKLNTIISNLEEIKARLTALENNKDDDFLALVRQYKDEIVTILMTATTWDELPIEINLADYIKVQ